MPVSLPNTQNPKTKLSELASGLEDAQKLIQGQQFPSAIEVLQILLISNPDEPEALYMNAVCLRYTQQHEAALASLSHLKSVQPEHGRAHQEEGYNQRALGNKEKALKAFDRACFYNPALEASYHARINIHIERNEPARLTHVQGQLKELLALPKPLIAVVDLISMGKLLRAEELCRQFLKKVPHNFEAMRLLADVGMRLGILEDAELLLHSASLLAPDNIRIHIDYIQILRKRQKHLAAQEQARLLLEREPSNPQFQSLYAVQCMQSGRFDDALATFDDILKVLPNDPITLTSQGHALKTKGESERAITSYQQAIVAYPRHGEAYFSLANLKTYRFDDKEMAQMLALQQDDNLSFMERVHLCFALGKAFEDNKDAQQSFTFYEQGNHLKKSQSRYNANQITKELALQQEHLTAKLLTEKNNFGHSSADPIFIVGMPRAGSTLIEQILSSHSQVDGTLELPNIPSLAQRLRRHVFNGEIPGYPQVLEFLDQEKLAQLGEEFIKDTRIHRQGAPLFIDKMPNNFRHIGLIKLMLPNAKIIDARRNPLDCCFSVFKQLFAEGQEFSYSLADIGQYYRDYVALMDHWDKVLPDFVLRVHNEDVIENLESEVRRLLEFCGLPFEQACMDFHKTERNVRTPSSEQVRRPVNSSGVGQWRKYSPFLGALKQSLGAELAALSLSNED